MGNIETYKNSKIPKGTFGDDDFNPMDLPVTYRVYDENGKVVGKTTSFNNSGAIGHKLGLKYKAKIVATDKSGNERVIQDGVNSSGNKYANGGGVEFDYWKIKNVDKENNVYYTYLQKNIASPIPFDSVEITKEQYEKARKGFDYSIGGL